jgi:hypothetical protein
MLLEHSEVFPASHLAVLCPVVWSVKAGQQRGDVARQAGERRVIRVFSAISAYFGLKVSYSCSSCVRHGVKCVVGLGSMALAELGQTTAGDAEARCTHCSTAKKASPHITTRLGHSENSSEVSRVASSDPGASGRTRGGVRRHTAAPRILPQQSHRPWCRAHGGYAKHKNNTRTKNDTTHQTTLKAL